MNLQPVSRRIAVLLSLASILLLAAGAGAQTVDKDPNAKADVISRVTDIISQQAFVPGIDFTKLPDFLAQEKPKLDKASNDEEFARDVNEALDRFGASHIVLWTPRTAEARSTGSSVGIGISARTSPDGLMIMRVIPDTPAADAGLVAGDLITMVDGKKAMGAFGIAGPEHSTVKLTVKKVDGQVTDYTLERRRYSTVHAPDFTWLDRDTAKISLYTFDNTYDRSLLESYMAKCALAKNLIIDLRDNGGGVVSNLQHFLSFLIPSKDPLGTFVSRITLNRYTEATHDTSTKDLAKIAEYSPVKLTSAFYTGEMFKGHVVVLINRGSGSAAEIAAAALRDTIGAEIVGTRSAGAVLISRLVPAADGFMIQYPMSDYVTIKGKRLEGNGVEPDIEAHDPRFRLPGEKDDSMDKALAYIDDLRHADEKASIKGF